MALDASQLHDFEVWARVIFVLLLYKASVRNIGIFDQPNRTPYYPLLFPIRFTAPSLKVHSPGGVSLVLVVVC